jgi:hypothetical protein
VKKLLLVNPSYRQTVFGKMKTLVLPPMGLATLASRTPTHYEVQIVDENVEQLDFNTPADVVGITATTVQAPPSKHHEPMT